MGKGDGCSLAVVSVLVSHPYCIILYHRRTTPTSRRHPERRRRPRKGVLHQRNSPRIREIKVPYAEIRLYEPQPTPAEFYNSAVCRLGKSVTCFQDFLFTAVPKSNASK
ncbi:hypothetical protein PUN28_005795 [Cardiocondyla obscurior]|uniref:Uncharacterized protein n=1 Tax=Cardiocondyla obscurior TaxID=286306 RepID=A0AAW2GBR5_9HYME